jgi:uncharacterized membrane protein YeaQ/YmgE (transglycosylase-associated protein family)
MFEEIIMVIAYAACGASIRLLWGIYNAEETFLNLQLSKKRLFFEFFVSMIFGLFGGQLMTDLGMIKIGVSLGAMVSSLLGANVVSVITKKFGYSKEMRVIVSDQQLQFTEFNPRQMNAMEYVKIQGKITNQIYQKINQTDHDIAKYELNALVSKKKLKRIGTNNKTNYVST